MELIIKEVSQLTPQEKRKIYNKTYLNTENGRKVRAQNTQRFYEKNPEKKENHYLTYTETCLRCAKKYYEEHKEEICARRRAQYQAARALVNTQKLQVFAS